MACYQIRALKQRKGANLWNISGGIRKTPEGEGRSLVAARTFLLPYNSSLDLPRLPDARK